jgi:hypothetical protein
MHASRMTGWSRSFHLLALATTLALAAACDGDDNGGTDGGVDGGGGGNGTPMTVTGKVTYDFVPSTYTPATRSGTLQFAQAAERPSRNVVVQARQGTSVLASTNTDESGNYTINFTPNISGTITLVALAKCSTPPIQVEDNTDQDAIWAVGDTIAPGTTTKNLHATHGWNSTELHFDATKRTAAPFAILDSMYTASKAFMAVRSVSFPSLKVNWSPHNVPQGGDKKQGFIGTSHYAFSEHEIYVLGADGADTDEFDSHVIVHEWGHYFEGNLSRSDSPGGPHAAGDVLDPRIAFGEGYGNAIAAILLPESIYTDTSWDDNRNLRAFGFDAETAPSPTDDPSPGPFSEMTVLRLLYDLYDSGSNESGYDQVGTGLGPIYDVLVGGERTTDALTTIGSFIAELKAQQGVNAIAVNTLLSHYNIGPISSAFGTGDTPLSDMYSNVASFPYNNGTFSLGGGYESNAWEQNQYYVFTGNGARITVTANSGSDVAVAAYQKGAVVGIADNTLSGQETFNFISQSGTKYVLVLTGFETKRMDYTVSVAISSP